MNSRLLVAPSPHIHSGNSTRGLMGNVLLALVPTMLFSIIFFGWAALYITAVAVVSCVLFEWLIQKFLFRKPSTIGDLSAVITGVLLSFNLPSTVPAWLVILGSLFAIGVAKMSYGGLGRNLFNPALAGRVFLLVSFPVLMTTYPMTETENVRGLEPMTVQTNFLSTDAVTGATPLAEARAKVATGESLDVGVNTQTVKELLVGDRRGSYGEAAAIALLLGFVWLLYKRVITWHIPVAILFTMFGFSEILWLSDPTRYLNPIFQILTGGALLGAVFMATDYVTSPMTKRGMVIYGVMIGAITILIRTWGGYPEGMSFAILLMNAATPLLNKIKPNKKLIMKSSLKNMVISLSLIALVAAFAVGYVYNVTKDPIEKAKEAKMDGAKAEVQPKYDKLESGVEVLAWDRDTQPVTIYRGIKDGAASGYPVESYSNDAYSGTIKLMVGFGADMSIYRVSVLEQSETPGLGGKIADEDEPFIVQFRGKYPASYNLAVAKDGGDVDAIAASTITSRAYTEAVRRAYDAVVKKFGGDGK